MSAAQSVLYYGTAQPVAPARRLKAGAWSALLIDGALHDIRYDGIEVIRAVSFLVRDKDWGTCRPFSCCVRRALRESRWTHAELRARHDVLGRWRARVSQ
jgi:hypothetical protein